MNSYQPAVPSITTRTTFTFSYSSFNTMLLLPPTDLADNCPILNVTVKLNCFNPGSYITTIREGESTEQGRFIGEFEMGTSMAKPTVTIGQQLRRIDDVLAGWSPKRRTHGTYTWRFPSDFRDHLTWSNHDNTLTVRPLALIPHIPFLTLSCYFSFRLLPILPQPTNQVSARASGD
jgi:hypothetical protein